MQALLDHWAKLIPVETAECFLAPRAFMTNSDGIISTLTDDLPGGDGLGAAVVGV